ncbi:MAG TPA: carboxypeptidase regulatory-like domain-containing protein [Candidatus Limnocylindrales bacterium]
MTRRFVSILSIVVLATALGACTPAASTGPTSVPAGAVRVSGLAHAGPTCPVVRPGDSSCADRPVAGAVLVVTTAAGTEVARATSAADGTFSVALPPGDYVLVPQPVTGLLGTARPVPFHAQADGAAPAPLDVAYDTGIR